MATGEAELVHESSSDLFWGQNKEGVGDNRLGMIIMDVRQRFREPQPKQ